MNNDKVLALAKEAGGAYDGYGCMSLWGECINKFAVLIQREMEAERDKCAQMNDDQSRMVYAAEERVKRMVELMKESVTWIRSIECEYGSQRADRQISILSRIDKAMSAALLKEVGE